VYSTEGSLLNVLKDSKHCVSELRATLKLFCKVCRLIVAVKEMCNVLISCRTYGVYAELLFLTEMQNFIWQCFNLNTVLGATQRY